MRLIPDDALAAITIWQEARGEPVAGKIAVGEVIRNRMRRYNRTVAEVVLAPLQFSGFNTKDPNRVPSFLLDDSDPLVQDCQSAWFASEALNLTDGASLYFNPDIVIPSWAARMIPTIKIGHHQFGRE
jgi:spore germination cell wall hydrolase CwlJ-like protein